MSRGSICCAMKAFRSSSVEWKSKRAEFTDDMNAQKLAMTDDHWKAPTSSRMTDSACSCG
eukprot:717005-Prymnesium_polylepis.1